MRQTFPYRVKIYYERDGKLLSINIGKIMQRMEDKLGVDVIKNILVTPDVPNLTTFGHQTSLTIH
jgi:hypothetical protein